jgi:polyisoprenoid-binding protein YceI
VARYRIVPDRSRVWIDARSSVHPIHSQTDGLDGWLELQLTRAGGVEARSAARGHIALPVARLRSGNPLEDRELKRRIDARRYPTITGDLTAMAKTDQPDRYRATGDVTFMGVTRTYEDELMVERQDDCTLRVTGESTFDVRDHGLEPPRILMLKVDPDVRVRVEIVAELAD